MRLGSDQLGRYPSAVSYEYICKLLEYLLAVVAGESVSDGFLAYSEFHTFS